MQLKDFFLLLHPAIAAAFVFPLIGIVVNFAWSTRQRRLQTTTGGKSKIPPVVGQEHLRLGRWLSGAVVGISLLGLVFSILSKMLENQVWTKEPFRVVFVMAMCIATVISLFILYIAKTPTWRATFATLTGAGLILLGCQPEVFRRGNEWYVSHYYYGIIAAMLMIFSLAIVQDIYKDKSNRWRTVHIILNCVALLLFVGQGITGTRDLLEIPLGWQEKYVYKLYELQCNIKPCTIQVSPESNITK
jgi:ABC-type sugar transport system permease subunit